MVLCAPRDETISLSQDIPIFFKHWYYILTSFDSLSQITQICFSPQLPLYSIQSLFQSAPFDCSTGFNQTKEAGVI